MSEPSEGGPIPHAEPDAERCAECGAPMLLDALGEMWMCPNLMYPHTGGATPPSETRHET